METKLFTRVVAADIAEIFERILEKHDIKIPSPEDDERGPENDIGLYGSTYCDMLDDIEQVIYDEVLMPMKNPNVKVILWAFNE